MTNLLMIVGVLGLVQFIYWLIVKGIIFVAYTLFNVNWYSKFWSVEVLLILLGIILKGTITVNHKEK